MGFQVKRIFIDGKIITSLCQKLNISFREAQKFVDRKRIKLNGEVFCDKKASLSDYIEISLFIPEPIGIKPVFQTKEFAVFDKPSSIAVHPNNLSNSQTLLDDIRYNFGKNANLIHRLDKETSGLIISSKNKQTEIELKTLFEKRQIQKYYLAFVESNIKDEIIINKPIITNKDMNIKVKILIDKNGKEAITHIKPIKTINNNTLIIAKPITGRQHQIRVHLFSIGHPIIGEPLYGVDFEIADAYLKGNLSLQDRVKYTKSDRLMLHSYKMEFNYKKINYILTSKKNLKHPYLF